MPSQKRFKPLPYELEPPRFAFDPVRLEIEGELARRLVLGQKLTALVAPPGYGKTVLMTKLFHGLRQAGQRCVWVSLDDRDAAAERLLAKLDAALRIPTAGAHPAEALFRGTESAEARTGELLQQLARVEAPIWIFIDNLNSCRDPALSECISPLVFQTGTQVRLVCSSTEELPLDTTRARLEGLLYRIGYAELGLGTQAMQALLGPALSSRLGDSGVETIVRQTEGWPAAARLMQIVLSESEHPEHVLGQFSGADKELAQLLNRRVLSGFDSGMRRFLLAISLLRHFSVELCQHASGDDAARERLDDLLKRNLFVIPLDRNQHWFRLHGLFREFLAKEADLTLSAAEKRDIFERAARWGQAQGRWYDAVDYALAAGSAVLAIQILECSAATFVRDRGDLSQYLEWIEALRADGHEVGLEADYWYVWALVFRREYEYARQQNERLIARFEARPADASDEKGTLRDLESRLDVIRIALAIFTDRLEEAYGILERWASSGRGKDAFSVATTAGAACVHLASAFRFGEARQWKRRAQVAVSQSASVYGASWISLIGALIPLYEGDYALAHADLEPALDKARKALGDSAGICGTLALLAAKCAAEMGRDTAALALLRRGSETWHTHGLVDTTACGLDVAVGLWCGSEAPFTVGQLRDVAAGYPPRLALMLSCFLIQRLLQLGRVEEALLEAEHIGLGGEAPEESKPLPELAQTARGRDLFVATQIQLCLALGRHRQVEKLIAQESKCAKAEGRVARLVELALAEASVALKGNNQRVASRHLSRAVILAAGRQIVRPFMNCLELVALLVNDTKPSAWGFALAAEKHFFATLCRSLPKQVTPQLDASLGLGDDAGLLEAPTAREIELLGLIDLGLTNQHLSDRLGISVATVKWHLYNLYAKLGVSSRSAAIARARSANLLSGTR